MPYSELIQRLFALNLHGGIKLGLSNCEKLQTILEFPDHSFSSIHVAGTNGKGSVVAKIASALEYAGYRVGVYTSPHISSFRERIRVNGIMISEADVEKILSHLFNLTAQYSIPATFFELTTFLALVYFSREKVDFAVLETGLGGRLDATNIVSPVLSIITSISLDHTDILGNTLEAIAKEKAGIIKSHTPVIIGPQTPYLFIEKLAYQKNSFCHTIKNQFLLFDQENNAIAKKSLEVLSENWDIPQEAIFKGLEAKQPCRFEIINNSVILDVAHNPSGLASLFAKAQTHFPNQPLRILFGLSKGKDLEGCLKILSRHGSAFHLVEAPNGRGISFDQLKQGLMNTGIASTVIYSHINIQQGVKIAIKQAESSGQLLLICGSFFIMSQVRQALGMIEHLDSIELNEKSMNSY
ncbi:bifunctional folylpolyglutamate synthase/dihydrofolate synthase [Candidatus Protochlamydia amoebophila]|nr:folylpolyglutamate synthase/dihydrofolate synthase family protein [Candidatus Protochlamydia amoebophila]